MKHKLMRASTRSFAEAELAPIAAESDQQRIFPRDVIAKMSGLHYFGLQTPKAYGGAELDSVSAAIVVEELSRVCAAVGLCVTVHNGVAVYPLLRFATARQKESYLPALCLLYTSDAADDHLCVDSGGRRIIKKNTHRI